LQFLSERNTVLLKEIDLPPASFSQFLTIDENLYDSSMFLPRREQIMMDPELMKGLCGLPFEFRIRELNFSPLGSWPTWLWTNSAPNYSQAMQ